MDARVRAYPEWVPVRATLFVVVALLAVPAAFVVGAGAGSAGAAATVVACLVVAMIVGWPASRQHAHVLAIIGGAASLVVTAQVVISGTPMHPTGRNLGPIELIGLYLLLAAIARWTTPLRLAAVAGGVAWIACVVWILRVTTEPDTDPTPFIVASNLAVAGVLPTAAAFAGGLPRYLVHRRAELVAAARREQRLELAEDLHDFVAHDLTGIVAQAQAARFARAEDVGHLRGALERIEIVGLTALDTIDGFVQVLHHGDEAAPRTTRGIADVPALVERFRAERASGSSVSFELDDVLCARVPRPQQATVYRVVVEGLTNVRRHAEPRCHVAVSVAAADDGRLSVAVTNEIGALRPDRYRAAGGTGLATLQERVSAVGGRLEAGPDGTGHWQLRAILPLSDEEDTDR
jgi:signal transduction histidine kinase